MDVMVIVCGIAFLACVIQVFRMAMDEMEVERMMKEEDGK